jgi:LmbE family N-acetylglucosaminyl deacetylase
VPSLLFVAAHPDDDNFGAAPIVAVHADDPDLRFLLIHATDGEAGEIAPDSGVRKEDLAAARRQEAVDSWTELGRRPDRHDWLGLPDGGLADSLEELADRIAAFLADERPDVVATFGPDGVTGHSDHVAVSAATTAAFHQVRVEPGQGLRRLLYGVIPQSSIDRWNERRRQKGEWVWDPNEPFHLRGVPDETIGVCVDTSPVVPRTIAALRRHRTQWSYQTMNDDRALADSFQRSHFVIAWPPRHDSRVLGGVFEDL